MKACVYCFLFYFILFYTRHNTIRTRVHFNTIWLTLVLDMCLNHIMSNVKKHWDLYLITKSQLFQFNTFECECQGRQIQRGHFLLWFLYVSFPHSCLQTIASKTGGIKYYTASEFIFWVWSWDFLLLFHL